MARSQDRSKRKSTGGRYHSARAKKQYELSGYAANTKIEDKNKIKTKRVIGGNRKVALLSAVDINVTDKKGKTQKTKLVNVVENPANPHLVRRNILTKRAVVETKLGKAKITSRPGQEGAVNAVLL